MRAWARELGQFRSVRMPGFVQVGRTIGANALIAASKFAVLPVLTYALAPTEFGVYALITATIAFGLVFLGLGVHNYMYRTVPGAPAEDAGRLMLTTVLFGTAVASALLGIAYASGATESFLRVLGVEQYGQTFALAAVWLLVDLVACNLRSFLLARERIGQANILDLLRQVLWIPLLVIFWLATKHIDLQLAVACAIIGSAAGAIYGGAVAGVSLRYGVALSALVPALRFSLPLLLPAAIMPLMRLADRSIISASRSLEEVASYSVLTALASGLYSCSALSIEVALLPRALRAANTGNLRGSRLILWKIVSYGGWSFAISAAAIWLATFGLLSRAAVYAPYANALPLFPLVLLGYLLMIFTSAPHNALVIANRTGAILAIDVLTLALAVLLDLVLIPPFGMAGAAFASIGAFGVGGALKSRIGGVWRDLSWRSVIVPWASSLDVEERDVTQVT